MAAPYGGVAEKVRRGSDDDQNSDEEDEYEKWLPDKKLAKGIEQINHCKGCQAEFKFSVPPHQSMRENKSVRDFYKHCLDECPQYEERGLSRTCDSCRSIFLNEAQRNMHSGECVYIAAEKAKKRKAPGPSPSPASSQRRRNNSESSHSSSPESNSPDQNDDNDYGDVDLEQQVQAAGEKMIADAMAKMAAEAAAKAQNSSTNVSDAPIALKRLPGARPGPLSRTRPPAISGATASPVATAAPAATASAGSVTPAAQPVRPRPGPKSKTKTPDYDRTGPIQRTAVVPKPEAISLVAASRKLSGKDLAQVKAELSRKHRLSTPSAPVPPKRKSSSRKYTVKKKRKQESESEDEEEYPDFILNLPDVRLRPEEYFVHIPAKSKGLPFFNNSVQCKACKKQFSAMISDSPKGVVSSPCSDFYTHCLSKCEAYMKQFMKSCDDCSHRYLDEDDFMAHKRGRICRIYKDRVHKLKLKMPWMTTQQFMDLLSVTPKDKMCCEACHQSFPAIKKGNEYTPSLALHCHMLDECIDYINTGKVVTCNKCAPVRNNGEPGFYMYINEKYYKMYDPCHAPSESEDEEDETTDPNSPYYGKGRGKGKGGPE